MVAAKKIPNRSMLGRTGSGTMVLSPKFLTYHMVNSLCDRGSITTPSLPRDTNKTKLRYLLTPYPSVSSSGNCVAPALPRKTHDVTVTALCVGRKPSDTSPRSYVTNEDDHEFSLLTTLGSPSHHIRMRVLLSCSCCCHAQMLLIPICR